eukprot:1104837-Alexandrium_andersonii.AAC.1
MLPARLEASLLGMGPVEHLHFHCCCHDRARKNLQKRRRGDEVQQPQTVVASAKSALGLLDMLQEAEDAEDDAEAATEVQDASVSGGGDLVV